MNPDFYAGIGSRETPEPVLLRMIELGARLAEAGLVLRSGGAAGADSAFEAGCDRAKGVKQVILPWDGFQPDREKDLKRRITEPGVLVMPASHRAAAEEIAKFHHPCWGRLGLGGRSLHTRNVGQVLGPTLDQPVSFVVCWTRGGAGGTGQAIRIAQGRCIPIYDLGERFDEANLHRFLETLAPVPQL